ncbi:Zn-dependent amino-or carboxypeptidase, M28 family [Pelomyxa schiedti]|nr:Zn-dependent amino-or carboxypeptidase, M28 family [Pelomyxa schiedti]
MENEGSGGDRADTGTGWRATAALVAVVVVGSCGLAVVVANTMSLGRSHLLDLLALLPSPTDNDDRDPIIETVLARISAAAMDAHWKYFSAESLGGRFTGSDGENAASLYAATHMNLWGLEPAGDDGTFFQNVPLQEVTPIEASEMTLDYTYGYLNLSWYDDFVATTEMPLAAIQSLELVDEELVFIGYGINSPDIGWNDYKLDLKGKVVICFVGQPSTGIWENQTYHWESRWLYKYEEAARQGAKAIFLVHTSNSTGWGWSLAQAAWGYSKARMEPTSTSSLHFTGWITEHCGEQIASFCNSSLNEWRNDAELRDFRPKTIPLRISVAVTFTCSALNGTNTLAKRQGETNETIIVVGHIDGTGTKNGTAYPGAIDNAAGSSLVMDMAFAWSHIMKDTLKRTIVFLLVTAEEAGLLGSEYFVNNIPSALTGANLVAVLNYDCPNTWGPTKDIDAIGIDKTTMGKLFRLAANKEDITYYETGSGSSYYRSDIWSFAKQGIPSVWVGSGSDFLDKPTNYLEDVIKYETDCYHAPCDAYRANSDLGGMVQSARVGLRIAYAIATGENTPECINNCR